MSDNDPLRNSLEEKAALDEVIRNTEELLRNAAALYGPAPMPLPPPPTGAARGSVAEPPAARAWARWLRSAAPDRLVTRPLWVLSVLVVHLVVLAVSLGAVGAGTLLLALLGRLVDPVFGVPAVTCFALAAGALSGLGTSLLVLQSFLERAGEFPW